MRYFTVGQAESKRAGDREGDVDKEREREMSSTNLSGKLAVTLGTGYKLGGGHCSRRVGRHQLHLILFIHLILDIKFWIPLFFIYEFAFRVGKYSRKLIHGKRKQGRKIRNLKFIRYGK